MFTGNLRHTASKRFSINLIVLSVYFSVSGVILLGSTGYGDMFATVWRSDRQCELSVQLQQSPYREEYVAKLATAVGNYWASNKDVENVSDAPDEFSFTLISFGRENQAAGDSQNAAIDSFSQDCMTCHDGLRGSDVRLVFRNSPGNSGKGMRASGKDHPIGMDYANYAAFGGGGYNPVSMLNPKMMLINGKVGCLTCHNPLNPEKNHLVMSDFGSALCLTCHNK